MMSNLTLNDPFIVLIDEMPIQLRPHFFSDYSAYQVLSLTALPLTRFRNGRLEPLAATRWSRSECQLSYSFSLRDDLAWNNGDTVDALDYVRGIQAVLQSPQARFSRILSDLRPGDAAISVETKNELRFHLKQPNEFFPELLSLICFSPLHRSDNMLCAGAYFIEEHSRNSVHLAKNTNFKPKSPNTIPRIHFRLIEDSESFDLPSVLNGTAHRSCSTAFPYRKYNNLAPRVKRSSLNMAMLFSIGNLATIQDIPHLKSAASLIDKNSISADLYDILRPIETYLDLFDAPHNGNSVASPSMLFPPNSEEAWQLTIAYEDYFPNRQILEHVRNQLLAHSIEVHLEKEEYGSREADCHLRFEIRQCPLPSPYLFLKSECSAILKTLDQKEASIVKQAFRDYQVTGSGHSLLKLAELVSEHQISIPLFEIPGLTIEHPRSAPSNNCIAGQPWTLL